MESIPDIKTGLDLAGEKMTLDRNMSDAEAIAEVQDGCREAYQIIVQRYMHKAYYLALGLVHDHQDALDLSQDAFIRAFRKIKKFDNRKPFFPWFYRLVRNLCLDHIKRRRVRNEIPLAENLILREEDRDKEMKSVLRRGLGQLPFDQKEMILLRYFQQLSYKEIAELTGRPLGSVMSALFYAKKRLKDILVPYLEADREESQ